MFFLFVQECIFLSVSINKKYVHKHLQILNNASYNIHNWRHQICFQSNSEYVVLAIINFRLELFWEVHIRHWWTKNVKSSNRSRGQTPPSGVVPGEGKRISNTIFFYSWLYYYSYKLPYPYFYLWFELIVIYRLLSLPYQRRLAIFSCLYPYQQKFLHSEMSDLDWSTSTSYNRSSPQYA